MASYFRNTTHPDCIAKHIKSCEGQNHRASKETAEHRTMTEGNACSQRVHSRSIHLLHSQQIVSGLVGQRSPSGRSEVHIHGQLEPIARLVSGAAALPQHPRKKVGRRDVCPRSVGSSDNLSSRLIVKHHIRLVPGWVQALGRVVAHGTCHFRVRSSCTQMVTKDGKCARQAGRGAVEKDSALRFSEVNVTNPTQNIVIEGKHYARKRESEKARKHHRLARLVPVSYQPTIPWCAL
jgi:hypothetical protein